jgi:uncharacterized membrane protein
MNTNAAMLAGIGLGASVAYLLDPATGRRRRASVRDRVARAANRSGEAIGATSRDLANRARGLAALTARRGGVSFDDVITERVRSKLGRYVSHPRAVEVDTDRGVVSLRGPILAREAERLLRAVWRVRGVTGVDDRLERWDHAGDNPALQGGVPRPGERWAIMQESWSPSTRLVAGSCGAALVGWGLQRRDWPGAAFSTAGALLLARAASDIDTRRLVGVGARRRAVDLQKTITINAPVADVFAFWLNYENFPEFLTHVRDVRTTSVEGQSHWVVDGPAGIPVEFDAVTTQVIPNEVLAWKTVEGSSVGHAGLVRFAAVGDSATRVTVRFSYNPPAGAMGHAAAWLLGADAKRLFGDDLTRMKSLLETGRPAHDAAGR